MNRIEQIGSIIAAISELISKTKSKYQLWALLIVAVLIIAIVSNVINPLIAFISLVICLIIAIKIPSESDRIINLGENRIKEKIMFVKDSIGEKSNNVTQIINTCIEIAKYYQDKKALNWLSLEAYGYEDCDENEIPDYRYIDAKYNLGHESENLKILLGHPIIEIEHMIDELKNKKHELVKVCADADTSIVKMAKLKSIKINKNQFPYLIKKVQLERILNSVKIRIHKFIINY